MKYGLVKKGLVLVLTLTMVSQNFSGITVSAAETAQEQLKPVFSMDFDNLSQKVDEKLSGTLQADTGQEVKVYGTVTLAEGRNASEKAIVLDNVSGKTGYLTLANTDELNPSSLTASVWLKRISPVKDEGRVFWSKASADWMGNGWFMGWTTEESMALVTNGNNVVAKLENAQAAMPEDEWINYTSVFDDATDTITLYKNGFAIAKKQTAGAAISKNTQAAELMIGKSGYGTEGLGCIIDELCIYNQALNAEQVSKLAELKDSDYIQADKEALYVAQKVSYDFSLPMKGGKGSDITWSSDSDALKIGENGNVSITRGDKDISVNITATLTYGNAQDTVQFTVIVARKGQAVDRLKKISSEEIVDISGAVGTRLKDAASVYAMSYLYEEKMDAYLNEYKNHSHSSWSWLEGEQPGKWLESMSNYKWMDKDGKIKAAITDVVNRLAQTQTKENKNATGYNQFAGYLGNATAAIRNATPLKGMDPYEMYSTLYGLMNVYEKYKEEDTALAEKALHCAIGLADYLVATIGDEDTKVFYQDGTVSDMNKMEFWALPITNGVTVAGHDVHQGWEGNVIKLRK